MRTGYGISVVPMCVRDAGPEVNNLHVHLAGTTSDCLGYTKDLYSYFFLLFRFILRSESETVLSVIR